MYNSADYPTYDLDPVEAERRGAILYIFSGPWSLLDNFAPTPVRYNDWHCTTSEHAFAASKAQLPSVAKAILACATPGEAKAMGRRVKLRPDWEEVKFSVMWEILCAKFAQNPTALGALMDTRGRDIVEGNTWDDRVWGMTLDNRGRLVGQNALGRQLVQLRKRVIGC